MDIAGQYGLDYIQLHGDESPEYCFQLQALGIGIIKACHYIKGVARYEGVCDYFLFDTPCEGKGGSGRTFDWNTLHDYRGQTPFLLSGGIGVEHINELRAFTHPRLAGYDVNSRFEERPAQKDVERLANFIKQIREHYE
jgi:phosphoribosylanthranilate isomerase